MENYRGPTLDETPTKLKEKIISWPKLEMKASQTDRETLTYSSPLFLKITQCKFETVFSRIWKW